MSAGYIELIIFGLAVLIISALLVAGFILKLKKSRQGKWLFSIIAGSGILAFALKGLFIASFEERSQFNATQPAKLPIKFVDSSEYRRPEKDLPQQTLYIWEALPQVAPSPADNPTTAEKIALGKKLFFDKRLSADNSLSCASCHELSSDKSGADARPHSIGIYGQEGTRNAPTVFNAAFQKVLFWDGRTQSLEEQAKEPLVNPIEMGMESFDEVERQVRSIAEYEQSFAVAFDTQPAVTIDNIAKAIAAYERTLITPNSPYDHFVRGNSHALSNQQLRGMALFESNGCVLCHSGPNFSGASIFEGNTPYRVFPAISNADFENRYQLSNDLGAAEKFPGLTKGVWRIPSLRNVSHTGPYFHNGSVDSLEEAVRIMANMQLNKKLSNSQPDDKSIYWSGKVQQLVESNNQALSDEEIKDIVAFLQALSGELQE